MYNNILLIISGISLSFFSLAALSANTGLNILTSFPPDFYLPFQQAFSNQYPDIKTNIRNKKTTAGLALLQRQSDHNIDIFWASAPDAFEILDQSALLGQHNQIDFPFPGELHGYPLKHKNNHYFGFALSGYGIAINKEYCAKYNIPYPESWSDLAKPVYYSHLALSSPSRSGTTHLMIEMILQHHGWDKGWELILKMAGNAATITARSYGVPEGVKQGQFGVGLVIDFLSKRINSDNIKFIYATETRFLPASAAILKQSSNKADAETFIKFLLSIQGQKLLRTRAISRLPINPELYANNSQLNPYSLEPENNAKTFNAKLSRKRYQLVNSLFDHFITFQLSSLQRLWGKLINAQNLLDKIHTKKTQWQSQLNQIKQNMSTLPLNEDTSLKQITIDNNSPQKTKFYASGYLSPSLLNYKEKWQQTIIDSEKQIESILLDISNLSKHEI